MPDTDAARPSLFSALSLRRITTSGNYIPEIDGLRIDPCIPRSWPGFTMTRVFRGKTVKITVKNPDGVSRGVRSLVIDGKPVEGALAPLDRIRDGSKIVATLG